MGFSVDYRVFSHIIDNKTNPIQSEIVKRVAEQFTFFAIILHDPYIHKALDEKIIKVFKRMDIATGSDLLFFTLVDPGPAWNATAKERAYFKVFKSMESDIIKTYINNENLLYNNQNNIFNAFHFAHDLGITADLLPCIIVTQDFNANNIHVFKTCENSIEDQFEHLTNISRRYNNLKNNWKRANAILREESQNLNLCDGYEIITLVKNLGKSITDILDLVKPEHLDEDGLVRLSEILAGLKHELDQHRMISNDKIVNFEFIDQLYLKIADLLAIIHDIRKLDYINCVSLDVQYLELDSLNWLNQANKVFSLFKNDISSELYSTEDQSPWAICLTKLFEKEISLSITHWFRKILKIDLPEYFDRYQEGVEGAYYLNVDFNDGEHGRWIPPMIGSLLYSLKRKAPNNIERILNKNDLELLQSRGNIIRNIRNDCAHGVVVNQDSSMVLRKCLNELSNKHFFKKLYRLKCKYREKT